MKRVVVTGGRNFDDWAMFQDVLIALDPDQVYVGDATGADAMARDWADHAGVCLEVFTADWDKHGKKAGPIRNAWMLDSAMRGIVNGDSLIVVAFPGGRGTDNCIKEAVARNLIVLRVEP